MSIGDINSDARGSGARDNDGKVPLELLPLGLLAYKTKPGRVHDVLHILAAVQRREHAAHIRLSRELTIDDLELAARVFDYGRKKYAAWNWAKGMPWSVPIACAARHLLAIERGEGLDPESGLPHWGHVWCNVVMLLVYEWAYPEGDDRPAEGLLSLREVDE
jgi:hypothetical protein